MTWGDPEGGGDSSAVQDELKTVQHIKASIAAPLLLPSLAMDLWSHGASLKMVATAVLCEISSRTCSKSRPAALRLLPSWVTGLWLHGAIRSMVVTAVLYEIG